MSVTFTDSTTWVTAEERIQYAVALEQLKSATKAWWRWCNRGRREGPKAARLAARVTFWNGELRRLDGVA